MAVIEKPSDKPLDPGGNVNVPAMELPSFRMLLAKERKTVQNVLIQTPYALGDCVCAEPSIRYAAKYLKGCTVSILTPFPELYAHIPNIKKRYNTKDGYPNWDKYYVLRCYAAAEELQGEFFHNFNMAIGDYIATALFKGQIPVADRNVVLKPTLIETMKSQDVIIHAGKHWVSKTFPKKWWDAIIQGLIDEGITPTLIGAKVDDGKRGYVEVNSEGCVDWRDKLTVMQSASALQNAKVVLTNDSAPYHMAVSGDAHIGVFSTVRHFDFIGHWRSVGNRNSWNHKTENLAKGQMWHETDVSPLKNGGKYDVIDYQTLMSWLPTPEEVVEWTLSRIEFEAKMKTVTAVAKEIYEQGSLRS